MSYNVDTHNLFSLLDGDGTTPAKVAAKPESKPAAKPAATTDKASSDKPATTSAGAPGSGRGGRGGARGGRGGARGGRGGARGGDRPPRGGDGAISSAEDGFASKPRPRRPAGEGRPAGERREKDGESKARPGKRTFDRRSGTGRGGKPAKSGAGGKGTWGKAGDELNAESTEPKAEGSTEAETTEAVAAAEGAEAPAAAAAATTDAAVPDRAPKEKDEDDKLLSLEEFEKLRLQNLAAISAPSSAPKREVQAQFNDCEKLQRDSENETLFPVAKGGKKKAKKAKKSDAVPIDKVFKVHLEPSSDSAPRDSPRGRGGRGRGRGGHFHKKDHHHNKSSSSSDSFDFDPSKFPSLQSK